MKKYKFYNKSTSSTLRLGIFVTSMPEHVSGWRGHEFESHSQPFLLTYTQADLSL